MFPSLISPELIPNNTGWWTISQMSLDSDSTLFAIKDINLKMYVSLNNTYCEGFCGSCDICLLKCSICLKIIPLLSTLSERNKGGTTLELKGSL